jgi:putative methyltransferase
MNIYIKVAKILREIDESKTSYKNAIYNNSNYEGDSHFKKIYKLVLEVLKYKNLLNKIIEDFFQQEGVKDKHLLYILLYEKFFSNKKNKVGGKLMRIIKLKEQSISSYLKNFDIKIEFDNPEEKKMLYFRSIVKDQLDIETYSALDGINKDNFIEKLYSIEKSKENEAIIKKIFDLKEQSKIVIQTKSSCIPAFLLKQVVFKDGLSDFDLIDSCSAPGNKTLQLGEYFGSSTTFAFEVNSNRFKLLLANLSKYNHPKNVIASNEDFLLTNPSDKKYSKVKVILADPSCSGSGTEHNSIIDYQEGKDNIIKSECSTKLAGSYLEKEQISRLTKLAKFQIRILNHCMKFPNVKYISYSTCSIFMTENEYVVNRVLEKHPEFKLVNIFDYKGTESFHSGITEETKLSLRVCPSCNSLDGFYVAIFQKIN